MRLVVPMLRVVVLRAIELIWIVSTRLMMRAIHCAD